VPALTGFAKVFRPPAGILWQLLVENVTHGDARRAAPLRVWFLTLGLLAAAGLAMLVVFALGIDIRFLLL
jgi:hypothetical protein